MSIMAKTTEYRKHPCRVRHLGSVEVMQNSAMVLRKDQLNSIRFTALHLHAHPYTQCYAYLKELLYYIVSKYISHQLIGCLQDLIKYHLALSWSSSLQFLLYKSKCKKKVHYALHQQQENFSNTVSMRHLNTLKKAVNIYKIY